MEQFSFGTNPQFFVWWKCIAFNMMCVVCSVVMLLILLEENTEHKNAVQLWHHTYIEYREK